MKKEKINSKKISIEIESNECCDNPNCENCGGKTFYTIFAIDENDDVLLNSSHYTPISTRKEMKDILSQFRQELEIKKFTFLPNCPLLS